MALVKKAAVTDVTCAFLWLNPVAFPSSVDRKDPNNAFTGHVDETIN